MPRISSLRRDRADDRYRRPRGSGAASVTPGAAARRRCGPYGSALGPTGCCSWTSGRLTASTARVIILSVPTTSGSGEWPVPGGVQR
jgi:hypothetical protein